MANVPYVQANKNLRSFLQKIPSVEIPAKVTNSWLESAGFTSSNDRAIPRVLEYIDFVDSSRKPTARWTRFRNTNESRKVLATAIVEGYSTLYQLYPDAHNRSDDDLRNFFRIHTKAGDRPVRLIVSTYRTLCSLADFGQIPDEDATVEDGAVTESATGKPLPPQAANQSTAPSLHIDIQIHIPSDASPEQLDKIFASMAKHLYSNTDDAP